MRELYIFLYLHLYFSNSGLVGFQGRRRRESQSFSWPQRCYRREEKEKHTVSKHGVRSSLSGLQQEAFALLAMWVSGDTLIAVLK